LRSPVALFGVMTPKVGNFRLHTIVLAKAIARSRPVVIVGENAGVAAFTAEEARYLADSPVTLCAVDAHRDEGQIRLYQFGNNAPHKWILEAFTRRQGVVLLHDPSLYWLVRMTPLFCDHYLEREVGLLEMELATAWINRGELSPVDICLSHMIYFNRMVAEYAHGVIVHSEFAAEQIRAKVPDKPVVTLPLVLNTLDPAADLAYARRYLEASANRTAPRFGVFGYMAQHKRIREVVLAIAELARTHRFEIVFAGKWEPDLLHKLGPPLDALQRSGHATVIDDYLDRDRMLGMMAECDFVIGLRYPTAGESSGIAAECNALATPIVFNPFAGFADIDPEFNVAVPIDAPSAEFSRVLASLCGLAFRARQDMRRARIDAAVETYAQAFARYGETANAALDEVERRGFPPSRDLTLAARHDPTQEPARLNLVFANGARVALKPNLPASRFAELAPVLEGADIVAQYKTVATDDDAFWHLVYLREADTSLVDKARLLADFLVELKAVPIFGRVFLMSGAIEDMLAAVQLDAIPSPLIGLLRRAQRLSNWDILMRALGLRVEHVSGHGLVRAVKRSEAIEGLILAPGRNPALRA
jgi:hypothetical protein